MQLTGVEHLDWPIWRLVIKQVAPLQELETWWSIDDVREANEALDAMAEADAEACRRQQSKL